MVHRYAIMHDKKDFHIRPSTCGNIFYDMIIHFLPYHEIVVHLATYLFIPSNAEYELIWSDHDGVVMWPTDAVQLSVKDIMK